MAISFSLNAKQLANLQNFAETGESLNLAAKRLLLSILDELLSPNSPKKIAEIDGSSNNQIDSELEPTLDTDLTSTEWWLRVESLEERIEKLETEVEILTTSKQPATPNNGESVIFLADSEGEPIQFWSGQVWVDDLDLAYRYKGAQAMARVIAKLKKRKLPGNGSPGTAIAFAPIENLLENGES
jgi:hypothetical protein